MITYDPRGGQLIETTAQDMIDLARQTNDVVKAKHNGIELTATPNSSYFDIIEYYKKEFRKPLS